MDILRFKKANCKNCYRCIRECPVKAIEFKEHQAQIIKNDCLLCGRCVTVCPQNAKQSRNDTEKVKEFFQQGDKVVATVAPSFIAAFPVGGVQDFESALRQLGFSGVRETAEGAYLVKSRYEALLKEGKSKVLISSCCHSVVKLIEKHYADLLPYLAAVISPMQASARGIKQEDPDAKVVFLGPCISKKEEAELYGDVDCVLTFDELQEWLTEENITFPENNSPEDDRFRSRFFPIAGGIIQSMNLEGLGYRHIAIDGMEKCIATLDEIANHNLEGYFIEMSACEGSCVNGPAIQKLRGGMISAITRVEEYAQKEADFTPDYRDPLTKEFYPDSHRIDLPGEQTIQAILAKTGKYTREDELNCGACGYPSCRDKAIAVYQGKAEVEMCLPYMKERAESLSGKIISSTPNAIFALDDQLFIQEINHSAYRLFQLDSKRNYKGEYVSSILEPSEYLNVIESGENCTDKKVYLEHYDKYVQQSIVFDKDHRLLIVIMRDITEEEKTLEKNKALQGKTVDLADKVIEKQMRVAQEIALLLGETTAETKIALTSLKNAFLKEEE